MKNLKENKTVQFPVISGFAILRAVRCLIIPVIALFILQSGAIVLQAQTKDDPSAAELERFRSDYMTTVHNLNAGLAKMKRNPKVRQAISDSGKNMIQLGEVREQIDKLSYDDLKIIYRAYNTNFPKWRESAGKMEQLAEQIGGKYPENYSDENTSNAITPDNCQDAFNEQPSFTDLAFAKGYEIAAMAAYEVVPEPLNGIAMAAWVPLAEGVNALETLNAMYDRCSGNQDIADLQSSLTNVQSSLNNFNLQIQENDDDNTSYLANALSTAINNSKTDIINNDNSNKTTITTAITDATTSINNTAGSNTSTITTAITSAKTEIVNNDNTNRTTIINNDNSNTSNLNTNINSTRNAIINNANTNTTNIINNANANTTILNTAITNAKNEIINNVNANAKALGDMLLRSQIEADLATESNAVKVAWYMTPTANGGHLDLVQQIVTQTLANIVAAGGSIGNAQSFLDRANADKAAGNFKSAYDNYRKAYKAAGN